MDQEVNIYITENNLCTRKDRILVAVSGGIDSMVLWHILQKLGYKIGIAHCNFALRGDASTQDEAFVREQSKISKLDFHSKTFDTRQFALDAGLGIQEAARHLRYTWFSQVMEEFGYNILAVAHHQDDQIETVLLNIARGTGLSGLQGMLPKREHIIRPLLFTSKEDIYSYASKHQIPFTEDSSNAESYYRRNYLRHKLIPKFERLVPSFKKRMMENILIWQKSARLLRGLLREEIESRIAVEGSQITMDISKIEDSLRDLVVYEWLRPYGFNYTQVTQMLKSIDNHQSGRQFFTEKNRVILDRKRLILAPKNMEEKLEFPVQKEDKSIYLENIRLDFVLMNGVPADLKKNDTTVYLDAQKISYPLTIRKWEEGDYFHPIGMEGRTQKLKKFFVNQKFSPLEKEAQWLLLSGDQVVWIIGKRLDDRFKVTENTKYVLKISMLINPS